ncbi:hypothetical protein Pfl01_4649 [Pseudomonas fluorescens Pf0-1]|uniref:Uncharacterized protein n=1 Tax=Pseudomonas fluorescens (strain Pf0-1) TaxID=205922 RepID=Q3K768_PSEPF|nr:hypothetical protein Pfl01_4649 [Pseudomonas fluorescens Pf0-1]
MQLGFDRQHFTLPRVGIFFGLNKGCPSRVRRSTKPGTAVSSYSNSWSKALLQTNSIWCGKLEGTDTWVSRKPLGCPTPDFLLASLIKAEQCREFSAGDCR